MIKKKELLKRIEILENDINILNTELDNLKKYNQEIISRYTEVFNAFSEINSYKKDEKEKNINREKNLANVYSYKD